MITNNAVVPFRDALVRPLMPVIPATWEAEINRIMVLDQPRQKASKTSTSTKKLDMVTHIFDPSYIGHIAGESIVQAGLSKN
jgi:hypothetical protein